MYVFISIKIDRYVNIVLNLIAIETEAVAVVEVEVVGGGGG